MEEFIEREALFSLGCGLIDLQLLASVLITPDPKLWTLDKHLARLTESFGVAYKISQSMNSLKRIPCASLPHRTLRTFDQGDMDNALVGGKR
ncbi:hypothetical protein [Methylomonas methanica]|uniref:hypothetical protein n=1 Tax=Methylomonas methanica TaxID=421 RepID=UPI0018D34DCE|nr:hypothetical protein [Methylomonas methanica]